MSAGPRLCPRFFHAYQQAPEQGRVDQGRMAADHVLIYVAGDYGSDFRARLRKHPPEPPRIQQPEQEADVMADKSVSVMTHRSDMHGGAQLNPSSVARHMVMAAYQDMEPVGDSHHPRHRNRGRDYHQHAITAVHVHAVEPRHA